MIYIKDKKSIEKMRTAGKLLAKIMIDVKSLVKPGISTLEIDSFIENSIHAAGLKPSCKGYRGYKHATCISLNDVVVHGVPSSDIILKDGDLVKIDVVASYKNYCVDMARSYFVGDVSSVVKRIIDTVNMALKKGIDNAVEGNYISDISRAIEDEVVSSGFGIVRSFAGHGVGKLLHEDPEIPNFTNGQGPKIVLGMTLAIEPMITEHGYEIFIDSDGWTARTSDGGIAGHAEDTVLVTSNGPEVLTRMKECQDGN